MTDEWLKLAHAHKMKTGELPLVVGIELYEYFEKPVTITSVYEWSEDCGASVVVRGRFMEIASVHSSELKLRPMREVASVGTKEEF